MAAVKLAQRSAESLQRIFCLATVGSCRTKSYTFINSQTLFAKRNGISCGSYYTSGEINLWSFLRSPSSSTTKTAALSSPLVYERRAKETLNYLNDYLDSLPELVECEDSYDVDYSAGVLTVNVSPVVGTYVINMQTASQQIWLSSPISGAKRYDYLNGKWTYRKDGISLDTLLTAEFRQIFNCDKITFVINVT